MTKGSPTESWMNILVNGCNWLVCNCFLRRNLCGAGDYEMAHHCGSAYVRSLPVFHDEWG